MRSSRAARFGTTAAMVVCFAGPVRAVEPPTTWNAVDAQPPGTRLVVELVTGDEYQGALTTTTVEDVGLALSDNEERRWPKTLVREVRTVARVQDAKKDGGAKGAVIGALAGVAAVALMYAACGDGCEAPSVGGPLAAAIGVGAGAGFGIGAALDAGRHQQLVLFRAPATEVRTR